VQPRCSLTLEEATKQPWRRMSYHGVNAATAHSLHNAEMRGQFARFYQNVSTFQAEDLWLYPAQV